MDGLKKSKYWTFFLIVASVFILQNCKSSQAGSKTAVAKVSYETDLRPIMEQSCTPCHFPDKGKKSMLDTYDATRKSIRDIITRIELPPDDEDFMPFKSKKPPLTADQVQKFKDWLAQGMPE